MRRLGEYAPSTPFERRGVRVFRRFGRTERRSRQRRGVRAFGAGLRRAPFAFRRLRSTFTKRRKRRRIRELADGVFRRDGADAAGLGDVERDLPQKRFLARERDDVAETAEKVER